MARYHKANSRVRDCPLALFAYGKNKSILASRSGLASSNQDLGHLSHSAEWRWLWALPKLNTSPAMDYHTTVAFACAQSVLRLIIDCNTQTKKGRPCLGQLGRVDITVCVQHRSRDVVIFHTYERECRTLRFLFSSKLEAVTHTQLSSE